MDNSELEPSPEMVEESNIKDGDSILDKPLLNSFYDNEQILTIIGKTYKGFQASDGRWVYSGKPIARSVFINNTINMLRSVINSQNFNSKLTDKQIDNIMLEKNFEYIQLVRNEPDWSLSDEHAELVINVFDHILETFFGIIENGKTADQITQIATGAYNPDSFAASQKNRNEGFWSWMKK